MSEGASRQEAPSGPPRLPGRLSTEFTDTSSPCWVQPVLDRGQGAARQRNSSITSSPIQESAHQERSTEREATFNISFLISILVLLFALFLIVDFYCGFKTSFFPQARIFQGTF